MAGTPHDTELYTLGRGILSIGEWAGGSPGEYVDVGNCPRFEVNLTEEQLEHYSHRSGLKTKDKVVTLQVGYTLSFDLDEISRDNLARFVKGTVEDDTIHALQATNARFAIKFTSQNAAGENQVWEFWKVKLSPQSAFALISDDWSVLSYAGEGESDTGNHAESPFFDVVIQTTTSTTTTTT